jgi:hypothetical protein
VAIVPRVSSRDQAIQERARIEHELDILRLRYSMMQRTGKLATSAAVASCGAATAAVIYFLILQNLTGIITFSVIALCLALSAVLVSRKLWIDYITPQIWGPIWMGVKSERTAIEEMIAERERRLSDLKAIL